MQASASEQEHNHQCHDDGQDSNDQPKPARTPRPCGSGLAVGPLLGLAVGPLLGRLLARLLLGRCAGLLLGLAAEGLLLGRCAGLLLGLAAEGLLLGPAAAGLTELYLSSSAAGFTA